MIASVTIGGAITAACKTCGARPSAICLSPQGAPRKKPHTARARVATPEQTVSVGDLLDVRLASGVRLAHLHAIPDETTLLVRVWSPGAQAFSAPKAIRRAEAIRLAGDNARTRIARDEMRLEAERAAAPIADRLAADILAGRGPFDPGLLNERPYDRSRDDRPPRADEEALDDKGRPMANPPCPGPRTSLFSTALILGSMVPPARRSRHRKAGIDDEEDDARRGGREPIAADRRRNTRRSSGSQRA